jgi:hypothetical protein
MLTKEQAGSGNPLILPVATMETPVVEGIVEQTHIHTVSLVVAGNKPATTKVEIRTLTAVGTEDGAMELSSRSGRDGTEKAVLTMIAVEESVAHETAMK